MKFLERIEYKLFKMFLMMFLDKIDQWERFKVTSKGSTYYIQISRQSNGIHYDEMKK